MGYYSKRKYFGFGKNSCITSENDKTKSKPEQPKPTGKTGGVFLLGVVVSQCGKCKRRGQGDPSMN